MSKKINITNLRERMNKHAPKKYNNSYPEELLAPIVKRDNIVTDSSSIQICSSLWNLDSMQDWVHYIKLDNLSEGDNYAYGMIVADGHGKSSKVIKWFEKQSDDFWNEAFNYGNFECTSPINYVEKKLALSKLYTYNSGSTLIMILVNLDGNVQIWNVGDSKAMVICDNNIILETELHDATNKKEIERLKEKHKEKGTEEHFLSPDVLFEVLPENENNMPVCTKSPSYRIIHDPLNLDSCANYLQATRSIGHWPLGITGTNVDYYTTTIPKKCRDWHIIAASDGVWDVIRNDNPNLFENLLSTPHPYDIEALEVELEIADEPQKEHLSNLLDNIKKNNNAENITYLATELWLCDRIYIHPEKNKLAIKNKNISKKKSLVKGMTPDDICVCTLSGSNFLNKLDTNKKEDAISDNSAVEENLSKIYIEEEYLFMFWDELMKITDISARRSAYTDLGYKVSALEEYIFTNNLPHPLNIDNDENFNHLP